jgi:hypothetical protein
MIVDVTGPTRRARGGGMSQVWSHHELQLDGTQEQLFVQALTSTGGARDAATGRAAQPVTIDPSALAAWSETAAGRQLLDAFDLAVGGKWGAGSAIARHRFPWDVVTWTLEPTAEDAAMPRGYMLEPFAPELVP